MYEEILVNNVKEFRKEYYAKIERNESVIKHIL